ncbi:transposase [Streptomyces sp. NPDC048045]|uniref:transposase n=1 Tax=Streptomyces sp. NPDC048045 TaxID=3154710 RepID=UPI003431D405
MDEFAFRKGCAYGTVLVDAEAGRVVDVLPDRTSETFAAWLMDHPGTEIICRDRATAYTKAVKEAAPDALEVADRWHLLQNLSAAVEKTCHEHRNCLRKHAEQETKVTVPEPVLTERPVPEMPRAQIIERTRHRYQDIHRFGGEGLDDQCDRPAAEPGSQDRAPLPRHRPRRVTRLRPRPPPQRRAGAVQGVSQCIADLVRHRRGYLLLEWIRQAEQDAPSRCRASPDSFARTSAPSPPASLCPGVPASSRDT